MAETLWSIEPGTGRIPHLCFKDRKTAFWTVHPIPEGAVYPGRGKDRAAAAVTRMQRLGFATVEAFQIAAEIVVDGIVGAQTWSALHDYETRG